MQPFKTCRKCGLAIGNNREENFDVSGFSVINQIKEHTTKEIFKKIMEENPNYHIESRGRYDYSALHAAALMENPELVSYLLSQGALVNGVNSFGASALLLACSKPFSQKSMECIKILLDNGADVNLATLNIWGELSEHATPLYAAAACANTTAVNLLLFRGGILYKTQSACNESVGELEPVIAATITQVKKERDQAALVLLASSDYDSLFGMLPREINELIVLKSFFCGLK